MADPLINDLPPTALLAEAAALDRSVELAATVDLDGGDHMEDRSDAGACSDAPAGVTNTTAGASAPDTRRRVISILLAALDLSDVSRHVDLGLLTGLLQDWFPRFYDGSRIDLALLWETLLAEEAIDERKAALPVAILCLSQPQHGLGLAIPPALKDHPDCQWIREIAERRLRVAGDFLAMAERVYAQTVAQAAPERQERYERHQATPPASAARRTAKRKPRPALQKSAGLRQRLRSSRVMVWAAGLLPLVALGIAVMSFIGTQTQQFDLTQLSTTLVLEDGLKQGAKLSARIADPRWAQLDRAGQADLLEALVPDLQRAGIEHVVLVDETSQPCATLNLSDRSPRPVVRLGAEVFSPEKEMAS